MLQLDFSSLHPNRAESPPSEPLCPIFLPCSWYPCFSVPIPVPEGATGFPCAVPSLMLFFPPGMSGA